MKITVQRFKADGYSADATAVLVPTIKEAKQQASWLRETFAATGDALDAGDITGAKDTATVLYTGSKKAPRLIVVGLGESAKIDLERVRRAASLAAQRAQAAKATSLAIIAPELEIDPAEVAQAIVEGARLGVYSYDTYKTEQKNGSEGGKKKIEKLLILSLSDDMKGLKDGAQRGEAITNGVVLARDLTNAPSNELYPEALANRAKELSSVGVKVNVLNKAQIQRLKMGGLLAVNQGSVNPPFFVIMEWNGGKKGDKPVVLVGKGITFDTGGISIKPSAGMGEMKGDMGGAAAVIGAMRAVADLKLPLNVVALVPTTENMPSGSAYKPGDIITFMNGKTAEIDNTDAEGRLILADALTYADRYEPQAVIDFATLTGACVIALGEEASGLMGNSPELLTRLKEAGDRSYDRVAELPLHEEYEDLIRSDVADVKNSGGRQAGAITAGLFLQKFIGDYRWAHVDIAGPALRTKSSHYRLKGGSGAGVRMVVDALRNWEPMPKK